MDECSALAPHPVLCPSAQYQLARVARASMLRGRKRARIDDVCLMRMRAAIDSGQNVSMSAAVIACRVWTSIESMMRKGNEMSREIETLETPYGTLFKGIELATRSHGICVSITIVESSTNIKTTLKSHMPCHIQGNFLGKF